MNGVLTFGEAEPKAGFLVGSGLAGLVGLVATLLASGAAFKAIADAYMGGAAAAGPSLRFASRRLLSILWVTVLSILLTVLGFVLLIVPGVYLAVALSVVVPVLMLEDRKGRKALGRSRELVKGRWWPTFGVFLLGLLIIPAIVEWIVGFIFQLLLLTEMDSVVGYVAVSAVGGMLASILATPLQAAVVAVLYFDLRVRKEGLDLQLLAERIGGERPDPAFGAAGRTPPPGETPPDAPTP